VSGPRIPAALVILGGLLAIAGSVLPWETVSSSVGVVNRGGLETSDAAVSLALGLAVAAGGVLALRRRASGYWRGMLVLASIIILGVFLLDANELHTSTTAFNALTAGKAIAGLGIGLYVLPLGAITAIVGVIRLPGANGRATRSRSARGQPR
jgi:uncharacterized membrane protein